MKHCDFDPDPFNFDGSRIKYFGYCFEVSYDLIQQNEHSSANLNTTHRSIIPCKLSIFLGNKVPKIWPYFSSVFSTMPDEKFNRKYSLMLCLDCPIFARINDSHYIQIQHGIEKIL